MNNKNQKPKPPKNLFNMNLLDFLSHELKTPLSTLRLNIELLKKETNKDNKLNSLIKIMDSEVESMIQLISDMLDLRQMDEHTITLKQSWCLWNKLIESVQHRISTSYQKHHLKIQSDNKTIEVFTDPALLRQTLVNLILNAMEHSPENSTIEISWKLDANNHLIVSVKDQGPGIDESEKEKIFMPFYKRPKPSPLFYKNSGLGLSIVKKIIESHGGTIQAMNHSEGGAVFSFTLPNIKK